MRYLLRSPWFDYLCLTVANGTRRLLPPWNPRQRRDQSVSCCSPFLDKQTALFADASGESLALVPGPTGSR